MNLSQNVLLMKFIFPSAVFCLAFGLYSSLVGAGPFHPDIITLLVQAQKTLETGYLQPYLTGYNIPVLLGALFIHVGRSLGSSPEVSINYIGVVFASLTIPVFYLLSRDIFNEKSALFGTIAFMTFPLFFSLATVGSIQIVAIFFLILGIKLLNDRRSLSADNKASLFLMPGAVLAFACAGASRPQELIFMGLPVSYLYVLAVHRKRGEVFLTVAKLAFFWLAIGVLVLLIPIPFLFHGRHFDRDTFLSLYQVYPGGGTNSWRVFRAMVSFGYQAFIDQFSFIGVLLAFLGAVIAFRELHALLGFLLLWAGFTFGAYINVFHQTNPAGRYLLVVFPPLFILLGHAFGSWSDAKAWWLRSIGFCVFIFLLFSFFSRILPVLTFRHHYSAGAAFAQWVGNMTEPGALIISEDENTFIAQYAHRRHYYFLSLFDGKTGNPGQQFEALVNDAAKRNSQVYVVVNSSARFFQKPEVSDRYRLSYVGEYPFEWWQHSATRMAVYPDPLYRVERK